MKGTFIMTNYRVLGNQLVTDYKSVIKEYLPRN